MLRKMFVAGIFLFLGAAPGMLGADTNTAGTKLTAAQIVEKNISARGGLAAWHAVQTIKYDGQMEAGGKQNISLPFTMELKRPGKQRIEIQFQGQTAVQVYDGTRGWKLRPFLNRRDVEPFTPEEMKKAALQADLDGPLFDYTAKGIKVELEGMDQVAGRNAYKLKLTMKDGQQRHIWVDSESFLDVKTDGSRRMDGKSRVVNTYFRDYRSVQGLMIPYEYETKVEIKDAKPEKIIIESVVLNPKLDDSLFTKPE